MNREVFLRSGFAFLAALLPFAAMPSDAQDKPYEWQRDYARISDQGDIVWTPEKKNFETGVNIRYIDYQNGLDTNDGKTKEFAWKHHPWDPASTGNAAAGQDIDTTVFKGGVVYRGEIDLIRHGSEDVPVRITCDPEWGGGAAIMAGSERVSEWTSGSDNPAIPDGSKVWRAELDFAPRSVWLVGENGSSRRIPLARHPNWKSQPEDHKSKWFAWTNEKHPFKAESGYTANDSNNLKGLDPDFVNGAILYSEFGWVMGNPYPSKASNYNPETGSVKFERWTGGGNGEIIHRGMRYYLEDKPQYLDDPDGEFWFDKKGDGGTLYIRLPGDLDPNTAHIEAGRRKSIIYGSDVKNVEISGIDFQWTTPYWNLDVVMWDFTTTPWGYRTDATPGCIRIFGSAQNLRISNCAFSDTTMGVRIRAKGDGAKVEGITVQDSVFRECDVGAIYISDGAGWGFSHPVGSVDDIRILRNKITDVGFRPTRYERGAAIDIEGIRVGHVAGNIITRAAAQGINIVAGKASGIRTEIPLIRILVHQNKVWKSMQNCNDFGGIESWQHGPVYIYNNLSFDARGQWEGRRVTNGKSPGFGHAYYLDGGYKSYLFNNIAWGLSKDDTSQLVNCAAFQEIHSYQNTFFNNTAYNYFVGSRRQAPQGGSNKYLGNIWQTMGERAFRHADPAKTEADGNAADAGPRAHEYEYESNAYAFNIFHDVPEIGVFEASGRWLKTPEDFKSALAGKHSLVSDTGEIDEKPILRDPANGDFRLNSGSTAIDNGAQVFVPWSLYGVAAEWNFYHAGDDVTKILDEHWFARDYMGVRDDYPKRPKYPLTVVNAQQSDYIDGPLENFAKGALKLDPSRTMYAMISDADLNRPYTAKLRRQAGHGQPDLAEDVEFTVAELRSAEIHDGNFLIETFFSARGDGIIISKKHGPGYALEIKDGKAVFSVAGQDGEAASITSSFVVADGDWRHVVVEADRTSRKLSIYVDGKLDASGSGLGRESIANSGDLYVGGSPDGGYLDGVFEFMRVSHGTLADARTTIGELYWWQFNGPNRRDMRGKSPKGKSRDAGALETY